MNIGGDDLYVRGFSRDLRFDREDAFSITNSSNRSPLVSTKSNDDSDSPKSKGTYGTPPRTTTAAKRTTRRNNNNANYTRGPQGAIETDFYRNPTILSRMILFGKYANANKRCRDHPEEGSVWVCAQRKSNLARQVSPFYGMFEKKNRPARGPEEQQQQQQTSDSSSSDTEYSLRQLPIHIACTALAFTHDSVLRIQLEQLIVRLVVTNPEGCAEFDHGGRLPLHEAIWSNATPETISMILMASPKSIDQRDKFGRTPLELNKRRMTGEQHKKEIHDMLELGVAYWDQARQEARLRMKLAVIPAAGQSVASTNVMGTSQVEKETIGTTDTANYDSSPLPEDNTNNQQRRKPRIEFKPEEITPIAWEQLERRVLLLEQLLAEMYETNYELAGVVEELQKTKRELAAELQAARALHHQGPSSSPSLFLGVAAAPSSMMLSLLEATVVGVVPEDDEMSGVKLLEHTERIDQLESLVGSYHSSIRRHKKRGAGGSGVSELSSFSSPTQDGGFIRNRTGLARSDSLVSGLTGDEASFFDTSIHAVKDAWRNNSPSLDEDDDDDDTDDTMVELGDSQREVSAVLGTDNLNEMFHKVAGRYGSSSQKNPPEPSPHSSAKEWAASPVVVPSPAHTDTPRSSVKAWASPMAIPLSQQDTAPKLPEPSTHSSSMRSWAAPLAAIPSPASEENLSILPLVWDPSQTPAEEDTRASAASFSSSSSSSALSASIASSMEESKDSAPNASEIRYPSVLMAPEPHTVNSTISISGSSASPGSLASSMSENTSIVSVENEISFLGQRYSPPGSAVGPGDAPTAETMSSRGQLEHMVFGGAGHESDRQEDSDASTLDPARYNFDIQIPALDTYYTDTGEI